MNANDKSLLISRTGLSASVLDTGNICSHHKKILLEKYEFLQRSCCDPFKAHKQPVKKGLRTVNFDQVTKFINCFNIFVKCGWKLCPSCRKKLIEADPEIVANADSQEDMGFIIPEARADFLNSSLCLSRASPVKPTKVSSRDKIGYAKRKWEQIKEASIQQVAECLDIPAEAIDGPSQELTTPYHAQDDIEYLVQAMKVKLTTANRQQQISLLTLSPRSWTIQKVATEFNVSSYSVRKARSLQKEQGILPLCPSSRGKPLSDVVVETVKQFYREDDISRVMPGAKDCIS